MDKSIEPIVLERLEIAKSNKADKLLIQKAADIALGITLVRYIQVSSYSPVS